MQKSENSNTAEQCLASPEKKKKKWGAVEVFVACFQTIRFLVNLFALVDKYGPKVVSFFKAFLE